VRHTTLAAVSAAATLVLGPSALAQESGTPVFSAPYRAFSKHELGLSLSAPEGADLGLEGFYSFASGRNDFGRRVGALDTDDDTDLVVGGRFRTRLFTHSEDFPLDGALTVGLGAVFYDGDTVLRVPIGLSFGRRIDSGSSGLSFVLYVHSVLIPVFSEGDDELGLALGLASTSASPAASTCGCPGRSGTWRASRSASPGCGSHGGNDRRALLLSLPKKKKPT
jgi:hypothetical protein